MQPAAFGGFAIFRVLGLAASRKEDVRAADSARSASFARSAEVGKRESRFPRGPKKPFKDAVENFNGVPGDRCRL
jgi:hypothetical protein